DRALHREMAIMSGSVCGAVAGGGGSGHRSPESPRGTVIHSVRIRAPAKYDSTLAGGAAGRPRIFSVASGPGGLRPTITTRSPAAGTSFQMLNCERRANVAPKRRKPP